MMIETTGRTRVALLCLVFAVAGFLVGYGEGRQRHVEIAGVRVKQIDGEWWARISSKEGLPPIQLNGPGAFVMRECEVDSEPSSRPSSQPDLSYLFKKHCGRTDNPDRIHDITISCVGCHPAEPAKAMVNDD